MWKPYAVITRARLLVRAAVRCLSPPSNQNAKYMYFASLCIAAAAAAQPTPLDSPQAGPSLRKFDASPYLRGALGGAAYGLAASSISHPFDTIKTRLQTKAVVGGSASVLSRVLGLYRGVGPATAASILFRTVPFIGYEATRSLLRSHRLLESQPLLAALLGGAVGGMMRGCVETPAELAKTRLQVGAGIGSASLLLRGLRSTCLRNAAVIGLFWVAYEASAARRAALPPTLAAFVGGGGCSVLAWVRHLCRIWNASWGAVPQPGHRAT